MGGRSGSSCSGYSRVKPRPSMAGSNRVNGWHVSAPDGSLVALLDEGVPVRAHTPLPADTPRPGAAATARDGRLESEPGPHQRCVLQSLSAGFLPISHLRFSRRAQSLKESSRRGRLTPPGSAPSPSGRPRSWYGGPKSRPFTREGGTYGYAFQDQARRSTTPASRATAPGSGAEEGSARRDGESSSPAAGLGGADDDCVIGNGSLQVMFETE
jgi:hypothetical protein